MRNMYYSMDIISVVSLKYKHISIHVIIKRILVWQKVWLAFFFSILFKISHRFNFKVYEYSMEWVCIIMVSDCVIKPLIIET